MKRDQGAKQTPLDVELFRAELARRGAAADREIFFFEQIDSTSSELLRRLRAKASPRAVVAAAAQRAGRGRLGRSWFSPSCGNLYLSLAVEVQAPWESGLALLPLSAGIAVIDALREAGAASALLKWPNDVLIENKKLAGLLCETVGSPGATRGAIVGLGVNLGPCDFAPELEGTATSVFAQIGFAPRPEPLAAAFCARLEALLARPIGGDIVHSWCERAEPFGRRVMASGVSGKTVGLDTSGKLLLERDDGERATICAGLVEYV